MTIQKLKVSDSKTYTLIIVDTIQRLVKLKTNASRHKA